MTQDRMDALERRRSIRFPVKLQVRCRTGRYFDDLSGEVLNMSSRGVLFTTDRKLEPSERVSLSISWPALLHDQVHLNLITEGEVVRAEPGRAAVRIDKYEFRTAARGMTPVLRPLVVPSNGRRRAQANL